jgi:hypothetical protein
MKVKLSTLTQPKSWSPTSRTRWTILLSSLVILFLFLENEGEDYYGEEEEEEEATEEQD